MKKLELDHVVNILERTPTMLSVALKDLPDAVLFSNEGEGTWSAFDVVGHLIHGEKTDWIPRLRMILEFGESRAFDPFDREAMLQASKGKTITILLDEFEALRKQNLEALRAFHLTPKDFTRTGKHPALGVVTLEQHLSSWVVHDLDHLTQVFRVIAKSQDHVGPWKAYLSVLTDRA